MDGSSYTDWTLLQATEFKRDPALLRLSADQFISNFLSQTSSNAKALNRLHTPPIAKKSRFAPAHDGYLVAL